MGSWDSVSMETQHHISAMEDFRRARRRADLEQIMAVVRGKPAGLLSYDEVRRRLKATERGGQVLRDIPLESIVGSVDRYGDFTRSFLPRRDADRQRWASVRAAVEGLEGLPPIEVYKLGEAYFIRDGHHRVSVASELGAETIQAYVTEVQAQAPLSPADDFDDIILKAEQAQFFDETGLGRLRPDLDMNVTVPGGYDVLMEHIRVHRYFMGLELQREVSIVESAGQWYDHIYMPVVRSIRARGVLRDFPGRTETDLYIWISEHRAALQEKLKMDIRADEAAADFSSRFGARLARVVDRLRARISGALTPDELAAGPAPGYWRRDRLEARGGLPLFEEVLVPLSGDREQWRALDQACVVAEREGSIVYGLRVLPTGTSDEDEDLAGARDRFQARCARSGVRGTFLVDHGEVARKICERSRWTDLVVVSLDHPPGSSPLQRISSGFRTILRRCPRPVLALPGKPTAMASSLLAYDGSPKAEEALYLAAYVAGRWSCPLTVVTVEQDELDARTVQARARSYMKKHGVAATYRTAHGDTAQALLDVCRESGSEVMLMGGYGAAPVVEVVFGSTVDEVLRKAQVPLLICR